VGIDGDELRLWYGLAETNKNVSLSNSLESTLPAPCATWHPDSRRGGVINHRSSSWRRCTSPAAKSGGQLSNGEEHRMSGNLPPRYHHAIVTLNDRTWEPLTPELVRRLMESMQSTQRLGANLHPPIFPAVRAEPPTFTQPELIVLRVLFYSEKRTGLKQEEIRDAQPSFVNDMEKTYCLKTVAEALRQLEKRGLVCRPDGARRGYQITQNAIRIYQKYITC
jgi:hypothetical protein